MARSNSSQSAPAVEWGERVVVVGTSGSGKSTLARRLAAIHHLPLIELDLLFWDPQWRPTPGALFRQRVAAATAQPTWICDGNYGQIRELLWPRATTIIWLRSSFPRTFLRILRRTVRRAATREKICGENRESFRRSFLHRDSIILWMLKTWRGHRRKIPKLFEQPEHHHLRVLVCRHPREAQRIVDASLAAARISQRDP